MKDELSFLWDSKTEDLLGNLRSIINQALNLKLIILR